MQRFRAFFIVVALAHGWAASASAQSPQAWGPFLGNAPLSVSQTSANVALPKNIEAISPNSVVCNTGANSAYVVFGNSSAVTATTTTGSLVAPGVCKPFTPPTGSTYIAAITASSTTTLEIEVGAGIPYSSLPGGAGGVGSPMRTDASNATAAALGDIATVATGCNDATKIVSGAGTCASAPTTNANLTGPVTSTGNATAIATGAITQTMVAASTLATGTSVSLTAPREYYVCTGTCTVTPPPPVAGYEFCVWNKTNVATVITLAALGSSASYENTARTAAGTAGTGTFVSGGAVGDKVCIVGVDSTHYETPSFNGTWVAN